MAARVTVLCAEPVRCLVALARRGARGPSQAARGPVAADDDLAFACVAEALAEGVTVIDYAPESLVTEDYKHLAEWVRTRSASATAVQGSRIRWSER